MKRLTGLCVITCLAASAALALDVGERVPDVGKVPLVPVGSYYEPSFDQGPSLEDHLLRDGVTIVHFLSPRPPRQGAFQSWFVEEMSALNKACLLTPYPCRAVAVVPFGSKGSADAVAVLAASEAPPWGAPRDMPPGFGLAQTLPLFYEPTWPRPGLYRTFAGSDRPVVTPQTYLVGPDRRVLAVRGPNEGAGLYEWLQASLPESVTPAPEAPSSDVTAPVPDAATWPLFRRSIQHRAVAPAAADTLPYTYLAWRQPIGRTFASPVVAGGTVYASTHEEGLSSLRLDNGVQLQRYYGGSALWSSPAVAGDRIFSIDAGGVLHALDRATLQAVWDKDLGALVTSSPVVSGGALYVGCRDGAVYAIDALTGESLWSFQTGGEISSSPALADGTLVIGSGDRRLYAIDTATGQPKWSLETGGPVDSSPTIVEGTVLVGSFDGKLYSVRLADGGINWTCELGGWVHSSPTVADGTVFVGTVNQPRDVVPTFNWIDFASGERRGFFEMPDAVYSSPTVWDELVLVGCRDNQLYAFDRAMTQVQPVWTFRTRSHVHASPVVVGDTVVVASFDGTLYALRSARPIEVWQPGDVVPRWFMAALAKELHQQTVELVRRAATSPEGTTLTLTPFDALLSTIRGEVRAADGAERVLPRDVPSEHPGAPYIEYVLTAGLLSGYPDGTFQPSEPSTRYQFSSALAAVLEGITEPGFVWRALRGRDGAQAQVEVSAPPLPDRPQGMPPDISYDHWAAQALETLGTRGLLPLDDDGEFDGGRLVTLRDAERQWNLLAESLTVTRVK